MAIRTRALVLGLFGLLGLFWLVVTAFAAPANATPALSVPAAALQHHALAVEPVRQQQENTATPGAPASTDPAGQNEQNQQNQQNQQQEPAGERTGPAWMGALGVALIAAVVYGGQVVRKKRAGK